MSTTPIQNNIEQNEETISVKDFIYMCLAKWHWFVISLVLVLAAATFYILRTQPTYTRSSQVMIKSDSKGSSISSAMSDFSDMGLLSSSSSVDNELVAIQSPAVMSEVVRRLSLDMNYSIAGLLHKKTIYGKQLPVNVTLLDIDDEANTNMELTIQPDGSVTLNEFVWYIDGDKQESDEEIKGKLLQEIATPIGRVVVSPTASFAIDEETTIYINRVGYHNTTEFYSRKLKAALNGKKTDIIDLSIDDVSTQRAVDILNKVIDVYNEKWIEDKNKVTVSTSKFIEERLDSIKNELEIVDEDISSYKSKQLLPDVVSASTLYMTQNSKAAEEILALNNELYMARYILSYVKDTRTDCCLQIRVSRHKVLKARFANTTKCN